MDAEKLAAVLQFISQQAIKSWNLADGLSGFVEHSVIDLLRVQWFDVLSSTALYFNHDETEKAAAQRRTKAGAILVLLCISRKKLRACSDAALKLLNSIVERENDELLLSLAHLVRPFVELHNPGVQVNLDDIDACPTFKSTLAATQNLLSSHSIHFNPAVFRYLSPDITSHIRSNSANELPDFKIQNAWLLETTEPVDLNRAATIMNTSNNILFGPSLVFKDGEGLDQVLKARAERMNFWAEYDVQKVTPVTSAFPSLPVPTRTGSVDTKGKAPNPGLPARPPQKRLSSSGPSGGSVFSKKGQAAGLMKKSSLKMLDTDELVREEREKYEQKKRAEEEAASEAARKKKEIEDKKQHAREAKERDAEEKRLKREKLIEDKKIRETDAIAKKEEEKRKREESRTQRVDEENLDDRRKSASSESQPSYPQQDTDQHNQRSHHQQQQHQQPLQHPDPSTLPPWLANPEIMPVPVPLTVPSIARDATPVPVVNAHTILGDDAQYLSTEDRMLLDSFLSGKYDKRAETKEIKLSETEVVDPKTGATQIQSLFLVLDYEACKWKKIRRKRKAA
ncbi:hypothetical protein HDU81_009097 [Chytriomyces hyalinus]|nr:hypothetical protein HDU81_009097 [Chytriomyces hyalinus]